MNCAQDVLGTEQIGATGRYEKGAFTWFATSRNSPHLCAWRSYRLFHLHRHLCFSTLLGRVTSLPAINECANWPYRALAECCACCCPFCSGATPARLSLSTATQEGSGGIRLPPDRANGTWNLIQSTDTWCVANIRKRAITRYRRTTSSAGTLIINGHRKSEETAPTKSDRYNCT